MISKLFMDKKIQTSLICIIATCIIVKLLGRDMFLVNITTDFSGYDVELDVISKLFIYLFFEQLINLLSVIIVMRIKHGDFYKYILIAFTSFMIACIIINVFNTYKDILNFFISLIIYLPNYVNLYFYVSLCEKINPYIDEYNRVIRYKHEIKPLLLIILSIVSIAIILSFLHAVLLILAI